MYSMEHVGVMYMMVYNCMHVYTLVNRRVPNCKQWVYGDSDTQSSIDTRITTQAAPYTAR
jgi:hypothetical protein